MPAKQALPREIRLACLLAVAAAALPLLRLLPGWLALLLLGTGLLAALTSTRRRWPLPLRALLTFALTGTALAAFGFRVGRDSACAVLLAMLALKITEANSLRDARSLVGFALFAVFSAFLLDQGPSTLLLAIPGLGLALDVFARLAAAEAGGDACAPWPQRLSTAVARLGLAMPLALAAFWFFPRMETPLWGVPENAIAKTGISGSMSPGDWIDVLSDDSPAFRVRFIDPPPPRAAMYWRGPVLWDFDGRRWTRGQLRPPLTADTVQVGGRSIDYEITMEPSERRYLFVLDTPNAAPDPGWLTADLSPIANEPVRSLLRYRMRAWSQATVALNLSADERRRALALPAGYNPRTRALVARWREEGADDETIIGNVLRMIRRDFVYDLGAPPLGRNSIDEFLFQTRTGFCEHYSSSFVFLMRAAGIPARIVTGYVGGYRNPFGDYWLIQQSDAHAWTEVWLPGRGWVRFDPTAAVDPARVFDRYGNGSGLAGFGSTLSPVLNVSDWLRGRWNDLLLSYDATRQQLLLRALGFGGGAYWQPILVLALSVGLALALSLGWMQWREHRQRDPLLRAWRHFQKQLARAGLRRPGHEPALAFGERAARRWPTQSEAILALSRRFAEQRYAEATTDAAERRALIQDLRRFRLHRQR